MKLLRISWIKRLTGFENTIGQMQEFTHKRDNDLLGEFTVRFEALGKSLEQGIVAFKPSKPA